MRREPPTRGGKSLLLDNTTHSTRPGRRMILAIAVVWLLAAHALPTSAQTPAPDTAGPAATVAPAPTSSVLVFHMARRMSPALLGLDQAFRATLNDAVAGPPTIYAEYLELTEFDDDALIQEQLATYLGAKYIRVKLDLIAVTSSRALRFVLRHRARIFPGAAVVFAAVDREAAASEPVGDVSGVWLSMDWAGTLEAARRLQPDAERAVVVTGSLGLDRVWKATARAQLERLEHPIPITYLDDLPIEALAERLGALPPRTVVLLGPFNRDGAGQDLAPRIAAARFAAASSVPVYTPVENNVGTGVVGGRVVSFEAQGRRQAELAARMLKGERPPPHGDGTNVYRFDARQLRRWSLDAQRLPAGSVVLFDEPSLWQTYRGYLVGGAVLLVLQSWLITGLLLSRAQRRKAQRALAEQLRFETLVSDVLATLITRSAGGVDTQVERALALIGGNLDMDRVLLAERNEARHSADITHLWEREGVPPRPPSVPWAEFPWISRRVRAGHVVVATLRQPLPPEADTDQRSMAALGTRSLLAIPLMVDGVVVGVLSCATIHAGREWPAERIDRMRLLAEVLATALARRRAETAASASEERFQRQREELAHALRVNTLGELGASLAHEINQPLAAIVMNARAMRALLAGGPTQTAAAAEALDDIASDAKRAGHIIDRLRALARKEHVPKSGLDLDHLIDEVLALLHQELVRKNIRVRRVPAPQAPVISGDPIQLQQIFLNLLMNASEAIGRAERNGGDVTVATSSPAKGLVDVAIADTGVGGKDLDPERMFDRFVSTKPGGLGMGLAISRAIAEAHGGRIYAKANPDRGLTVHVELPLEERP
jgi:signal transduction histidine kinase